MTDSASHVFVLSFETEQLTGRCVRLDGTVAVRFTRKPRDAGDAASGNERNRAKPKPNER
jgi:hypothetical protein